MSVSVLCPVCAVEYQVTPPIKRVIAEPGSLICVEFQGVTIAHKCGEKS